MYLSSIAGILMIRQDRRMKFIDRLFASLLLCSLGLVSIPLTAQNVGIGTATPLEKLHVAGNLRLDALAGIDTRLVAADDFGSLTTVVAGAVGQVLTQGATGPIWQNGSGWDLLGNAGTTPATNFVGTTDAQGLAFRTGNVERARFTAAGLLCVNGTGPYSSDLLSVFASGAQWAVNGYASGSGDAGFFYSSGSGAAIVGQIVGTSGSAAEFLSLSPTTNTSSPVYIYNGASTAPTIALRTDVANPAAHGISLDINGASSHRGIQVDMDAAGTGVGVAVLQNGLNHGLSIQSFNPAVTQTALLSDQAGLGRAIAATTYLTTSTTQAGLFTQFSNGIAPGTYGNAAALWGQSSGIRGGAFLAAGPSSSTTVLQALYNGPAGNYDGVAIFGIFQPNPNYGYGVVGQGNWYGVYANGNTGASGVKSFMIDHPLNPTQQYLRHFSIESPEVLNLYRGTVVLDANAQATVQLPNYFHSVNVDFSYHLTPIGAGDPYVDQEIDANGTFRIGGGQPGQKICWMVYADRNDPFVQQHPESISVEVPKRPHDIGLYLQPDLYGAPKEKGIFERYKVQPEKVSAEVAPATTVTKIPQPNLKPLTRQ
jgi:hypothetical protein